MAIKTTSKIENIRETITFTEDEVIAVIAQHYGLDMKGPRQYDVEVEVSNNLLREIKFTRTMTATPIDSTTEI